jgi:hypothetical protein|tara:strand:- start:480 stop:980 length:501 start_codon:yes stop_codon:yes gene_type:complete
MYCGWWIFFLICDFIVAGLMAVVAAIQIWGSVNTFLSLTVSPYTLSNFFLGSALISYAILIVTCCFCWLYFVGRFMGFMFYLTGRGVSYFLLGLLTLTDPRILTTFNIVQFCLCWCLIVVGIVYIICGCIPGVRYAYRPIFLFADSKVAVRHTDTYYENSLKGQRG